MPTSSYKDLVCGTYESHCKRSDGRSICATNVHLPATRMAPIRTRPMGSNRLSSKYTTPVPIETGIGTLFNHMGWSNVIDLNVSTYFPSWIHHGIEFFQTPYIEIPWRLLDHGYIDAKDHLMWYIIPRGKSVGVFYFVSPDGERTEAESGVRDGLHHLLEDDGADLGMFAPRPSGTVSIDAFVGRILHQKAWLIHNTLLAMIPKYMTTHAITKASISNRKHRIIRLSHRINGILP
jgi:hypothetical protein